MNNYPEGLRSALKGLYNDHTKTELITELFKSDLYANSELKIKLNLLVKQYTLETVTECVFKSEENRQNMQNIIRQNEEYNSTSSQSEINNLENKINYSFKNNCNPSIESNENSSLFREEKNEGHQPEPEGFLRRKKKRKNGALNENKVKRQRKRRLKSRGPAVKVKNGRKIADFIDVKKGKNGKEEDYGDYDFISNDSEGQKNNCDKEGNEEKDKVNKEENNSENDFEISCLKDLDFALMTHDSDNDSENYYFTGKRINGKKSGFGIYMHKDKKEYFQGNWKENEMLGFGIYVDKRNHNYYKGNFVNTSYNGIGKLTIKEKNRIKTFEGEFKDDQPNGFGTYYYNKTKSQYYTGEVEKGLKSGIGTSVKMGKFTFECEYKEDKENGIGTLKFDDGDIYTGEVYEGKLEGWGEHMHGKKDKHFGSKYYAYFKKGKPTTGFYINGENRCFAEFRGLTVKNVLKKLK